MRAYLCTLICANLKVSYTHFIPLALDKVTIVRNFLCYNPMIHLNAWKMIIEFFTHYISQTISKLRTT